MIFRKLLLQQPAEAKERTRRQASVTQLLTGSSFCHAHNCSAMGNTQGQNRAGSTGNTAFAHGHGLEKLSARGGGGGTVEVARRSSNLLPLAASIGSASVSSLQERRRNSSSSKSGGGIFSRFVSQRQQRVRTSASTTATSPTNTSLPATPLAEWSPRAMATVAEVEHGQLNGNTEQMDFRKSISSSASAFSSLFLSLSFSLSPCLSCSDCYYCCFSSFR